MPKATVELTDYVVEFADGEETVTAEYYVRRNGEYLFYTGTVLVKRISAAYVVKVHA